MTAETSNARGETYTFDMIEDAWGDAVPLTKPYFDRFRARLEALRQQSAAPPPAAARGDVRGLVALAERVQYADTHALVSKDDAGEFICLPPWLWLEIRDAAVEALAAEGVQAGEVEQRARELLAAEYRDDPHLANKVRQGTSSNGDLPRAIRAIVAALSQQPEARGVVDVEAIRRLAADMMTVVSEVDDIGALGSHVVAFANRLNALTEARNVR